jgi:hypothetical protein
VGDLNDVMMQVLVRDDPDLLRLTDGQSNQKLIDVPDFRAQRSGLLRRIQAEGVSGPVPLDCRWLPLELWCESEPIHMLEPSSALDVIKVWLRAGSDREQVLSTSCVP